MPRRPDRRLNRNVEIEQVHQATFTSYKHLDRSTHQAFRPPTTCAPAYDALVVEETTQQEPVDVAVDKLMWKSSTSRKLEGYDPSSCPLALHLPKPCGVGREAVGQRTIQTRWVDREKDGRVKSRLVLKDYSQCQGRTQPEMFSPTPSTLSLKTMLAASSHDRNNDLESNHITVSIDVHTAFLHADVDQDLFAEPPEPDEWYDAGLKEDEVWKLNVASAPRECPGKSELSPTPDGPKLFPKR